MNTSDRQQGFTLKELIIAVAIVMILSAIAMRSFRKAVLKNNRQNGVACLVEVQKRIEDYYTRNAGTTLSGGTGYPPTGDLSGIGYAAGNCPIAEGKSTLYTLTYVIPDTGVSNCALCYKLTATPVGKQAQDGTLVLSIDPRSSSSASANNAYHKQHITPAGTTLDNWIFNPGQ
jgi:prepilin-type N-terminal cleavage/methylation domain-containing protein